MPHAGDRAGAAENPPFWSERRAFGSRNALEGFLQLRFTRRRASAPRLTMDMWPLVLLLVQLCLCSGYEGSGHYTHGDDEDWYSRRYKGTPWCAPIKVKHGDVSCRTPRGEHYRNVMGTRCKIRCKQGYETQSTEVVCMASKHWSSNYACRQIRCPKPNMPVNGGYKCSDGSYFSSRCEFFCSPGFSLKGQKTATCQHTSTWSAAVPTCVDVDPPKIKCPNVKDKWAEPGKLTAKVTWDTPEGDDTADGILTDVTLKGRPPKSDFPEGLHKMSYTVFDRAGNKGACRFTVRVRAMSINVGVRTADALLDQFYEKRRLLIISAPTAANHNYRFQMTNLQPAQCGLDLRHVTVIELVGTYPAQIGRIGHRLLPPGLALQLRLLLRIPQRSFQMLLLDKQGIDKQRYPFPVTAAELFTTVDTFPLRRDEMALQQEAGQSCQS
ncbi:sushi repeat-containing protein SRPX isoform X2 [Betta splendens]|uniref:Sushi repeat-containing protein SRPX isoform X2 n=1 Tax=Betta splendens TaxID=158456 RepID=A0A8M1H8Y3_BETSP|nr:sushi repeat-containing protein SRPX isoform X2 [Betta splendens]